MKREIFNQEKHNSLRKELRNNPVKSERIFWQHIKGKQNGFKFRRQQGIGPYIIDFYCPEIKLVVEIDGLTHAEEEVFENDQLRQKYLENLGLIVKRYSTEDVFNNLGQILDDLYELCVRLRSANTSPTNTTP